MVVKGLILYAVVAYTLHVGFDVPSTAAIITASIVTIMGSALDAIQKIQEK